MSSYYFVGQSVGSANNAGAVAGTTGTFSGNVSSGGQFQAANGSAAAPSYSFTNSLTTGLYRAGASILGFSTAGVSAATISAAQVFTFVNAPVVPSNSFPESAVTNLTSDLAAKATDSLVVHLAGTESITGVKTFTANPVFNAASIPESAVTNLTTDLAAKATDSLVVHLAGTETVTGAKTFSGGMTTGTINITGGAANTLISTTGSSLLLRTNGVNALTIDSSQYVQIGNGTGANLSRSAVTGGLLMSNTGGSGNADGKPLFAMFVDTTFGTASVPPTESHYVATSRIGALQRTLPTPANSSVGQIVYVVQEAANVFTVGVPAGVTCTMKTGNSLATGADILTTKTATNFVSSGAAGDDGTSAMLVCMSTDTSTVATWRQLGGVGDWT